MKLCSSYYVPPPPLPVSPGRGGGGDWGFDGVLCLDHCESLVFQEVPDGFHEAVEGLGKICSVFSFTAAQSLLPHIPVRESSARFFGLGFFHGSSLYGPQISRLKGFSFVLANLFEYFDESAL
jgi:hypothetical protein